MSLYDRIFKPHVYTLADGTAVEEAKKLSAKYEAGDIVNHFKWNISIVSVGVTGERDA